MGLESRGNLSKVFRKAAKNKDMDKIELTEESLEDSINKIKAERDRLMPGTKINVAVDRVSRILI